MIFGILDRYILAAWLRIFALSVIGLPLVAILVNLVDRLSILLDRGLTAREVALSYLYTLPEQLFLIFPAAVLFATVFTVGALARNSEITAAKACGRSFHRVILPIVLAAAVASMIDVGLGEMATETTAKSLLLQKETQATAVDQRYNFIYRNEAGWTYAINSLDVRRDVLRRIMLERKGVDRRYPSLVVTADSAVWDSTSSHWRIIGGTSRILPGGAAMITYKFASARVAALSQSPTDLLAESKAPEEMRWKELGRYITALERSGNDASKLRTERMLKLSMPFACLVIALFGAPLAMTSARAGAAWGIAVSLGTTLVFLLTMQLAKAVGEGGLVQPEAAAWIPNVIFLLVAAVLLTRVRS